MIGELKPYSAYKDSGVAWLGDVPGHWEVRRQRNAVEMRVSNIDKHTKEGELPVRLCNYVDVYKNDRISERMPFMRVTATPDEIERFRLRVDDVLITKDSETWDDIGVPALVEYEASDFACGYHLALLRPIKQRLLGAYLFRAHQSKPIAYQYHVSANGVTRYGLSHDAIKSVLLPIPPLPEQAAIVRFLDHADRRIRRYIISKQKLIDLLNEQKQIVIYSAVTRGLDPRTRLKPAGIEGLNHVPEHWSIRKLGSVASIFNGTTPSRSQSRYWDGGTIPWLSSGKVNDEIVRDASELITPAAFRETSLSMVPRGSLIIGLVGQGKTRGMCALLDIDACINQNLAAIVPGKEIYNKFLFYMLTGSYRAIRDTGRGGNQAAMNCEIVSMIRIPLPPFDEQKLIVDHLDRELRIVREAQEKARAEIVLLREFRTRLITDVVTGKLDVREAAAALPDETDEYEPIDVEAISEGERLAEDDEISQGALTEAA